VGKPPLKQPYGWFKGGPPTLAVSYNLRHPTPHASVHRVHLKPEVSVTFIETDKPQYKPGDDVKLRVLTINALLKPNLAKLEEVWIENPKGRCYD
jgi:hypothetical protein